MKPKRLLIAMLLATALQVSAQEPLFVGGDISLLPTYEAHGANYMDQDGQKITDLLSFLKAQGMNTMRVRLFVDPNNATQAEKGQGVCQNLDYVKALGKRIKEAGLSLMLDFHYSDTWADPAKQWTPKAWLNLTDDQLYTQIYEYTKDCLRQMVEAGATPDFIQTGNEISYGMLYGEGIIVKDVYTANEKRTDYEVNSNTYKKCYVNSDANWPRFIKLLQQAILACREVCPDGKVIIHTERVGQPAVMTAIYNKLKTVDYDIIGLSYYPYFQDHGNLSVLSNSLSQLESQFPDKKIMVVETGCGYHWQMNDTDTGYPLTYEGQQQFTADLISTLKAHQHVNGLFWWFLEANEYGLDWATKRVTDYWHNAGLFDNETGCALPALYELKTFVGNSAGLKPLFIDSRDSDAWYTIEGVRHASPSKPGLYIHNGRKVVIR